MTKISQTERNSGAPLPPLHSELLLLPDGRVLVHNLTPEFARFLSKLGMPDPRMSKPLDGLDHELRDTD